MTELATPEVMLRRLNSYFSLIWVFILDSITPFNVVMEHIVEF